MLIKERDDNTQSITILKKLLTLPSLTDEHEFLISRELRNIQQGEKGEKNSAYYLNFYFGENSKYWAVIHDLRLEINGRVAQIDHLLFNRFFEFFVLESKNFSNGIEINEQGEFVASYSARSYGIPSPIDQNARHIAVLKDLFKETDILPRRLGLQIKPHYFNYVLMSPESLIKRPNKKHFNTDNIIRADALKKTIIDYEIKSLKPKLSDLTSIYKWVSSSTVEELAKAIISFHKPHQIDYIKKFGIKKFEAQPSSGAEKKQTQQMLCPKCKSQMVLRTAKTGKNFGNQFWGCSRYPSCRGIVNINI